MAITKLTKGNSFAGVLAYGMGKEDAEVLDVRGVSSESDIAQIAREMRAVADSASISKPVLHLSMSAPHGEQVSVDQWRTAANTWLREMGADPDKVQYVLGRHKDTEHDHVHLMANRVQLDGRVIRDQHDYRRSHAAMRVAEREAGMQAYEKPSKEATKGRIAELRQAIDKALASNNDFASFKRALEAQSIKVLANQQSTGRIAGLSFVANGHAIKGSSLGKGYSLNGLRAKGLEIEAAQTQKVTPMLSAANSKAAGTKLGRSNTTPTTGTDKNKADMDRWIAQRRAEAEKKEAERKAHHGAERDLEQELE